MVKGEDNIRLVPELYTVTSDKVEAEYQEPGSQQRQAIGRCPFLWAQSLYILGNLLQDVSQPCVWLLSILNVLFKCYNS